jgi:hypothetical protein
MRANQPGMLRRLSALLVDACTCLGVLVIVAGVFGSDTIRSSATSTRCSTGRSSNEPEYQLPVFVKRKGMKDAWCLAVSKPDLAPQGQCSRLQPPLLDRGNVRDTKDITFGLGLRATHIRDAERRDRLHLLIAIAQTLLTPWALHAKRAVWTERSRPPRSSGERRRY